MGDHYEMIQVPNCYQWCCGLICTYPNVYVIAQQGKDIVVKGAKGKPEGSAGVIIEGSNYCCQKCCMPSARSYTATLESPLGGEYKFERPFTLGSFCALPCCMPQVKVFKGDTHIGTVT